MAQQTGGMESYLARPEIADMLRRMDPEERKKFITELSLDYEGEAGILNEQLGYADELRRTPTAEGRSHGDVYVAPNFLEHLNTGLSRMKGNKERKEARSGAKDLSSKKSGALARLMGGISGADGIAEEERVNALPSPVTKPIQESQLAAIAEEDMGSGNTGIGSSPNLITPDKQSQMGENIAYLKRRQNSDVEGPLAPFGTDAAYAQRRAESDVMGPIPPVGYGDALRKKKFR